MKNPAPTTITVDLPVRFYEDHVDRDLPAGTLIKQAVKFTRVELDREAYDDLLSDAEYYADSEGFDMREGLMRGLVASARATIKKLRAVEPPAPATSTPAVDAEPEGGTSMTNTVPEVTRTSTKRWAVDGYEKTFTSKKLALIFAREMASTADSSPAPEQEPEQEPVDTRYDVLMGSTNTPVLGNANLGAVTFFLAQRLAQSKVKKPLKAFKVQDRTLREDPEHEQDYENPQIDADVFAVEHVTKELVEEARQELAQASKDGGKTKKVVRTMKAQHPSKPSKAAHTPPMGERFADEQVITSSGGKITYGMVRTIRAETEQFFQPGAPRGKIAAYQRLAQELGLGMETVAKISRRNIFADVE